MIINPIIPVAIMLPIVLLMLFLFVFGTWKYVYGVGRKVVSITLAVLICLCIFVIDLRIMKYSPDSEYSRPNLDVLFVVDTTISMWATDYGNGKTRYEGVQDTCEYIMEKLKGSSFALITFNDTSDIRLPLTQDIQSITDVLDSLDAPSQYISKGTSLNSSYADMARMLEHMGNEEGHLRVVFFITDGEITNEEELISYADLSEKIDAGAVLGFGTEEGAKMKDGDGITVRDWSSNYKEAISCIDEDNLIQLSGDLGVEYVHITKPSDVDGILQEALTNSELVTDTRDGLENYEDTYYYLVPVLLILLLCELLFSRPAVI